MRTEVKNKFKVKLNELLDLMYEHLSHDDGDHWDKYKELSDAIYNSIEVKNGNHNADKQRNG